MHQTRQFARSVAVLAALLTISLASVRGAEDTSPNPEKERELIEILRSDAPAADKALACKHLAVHGSEAAVPELARLLIDEQLASWARIPLEVIPGPAADEALRKALDSTQGKLQVGAINSIGVRRDAGAVEILTLRLEDQDPEVASAAAVALGKIANPPAIKSLRSALAGAAANVPSAVAEGLVLCAERLLSEDNAEAAAEIYDEVRKAEVPQQRILEATRGAILARKDKGVAILIENLNSPEKPLFQIALGTARELPGKKVDEALAGEITKAAPDRAALIVVAMADRPETVVLPAVLKAAGKGPKEVRLAALGALGRVGDATCLSALLDASQDSDSDLARTAKAALAELPGAKVDNEIVARLAKADAKSYPLLLDLIGQRLIEADAALLKAADHADKNVRSAAFKALGKTVTAKNLGVLISQFLKPKRAEDAPLAQQALMTACIRMPDREACAEQLAVALERSPAATKKPLLEILTDVGGTKALKTVAAAANSKDPQLQDDGSRLLGKWSTVDAAPVLLDLAKTSTSDKFHLRAIKGYIALARKFATIPEAERIEMCQNAMAACRRPAELGVLLDVLKLYPSVGTLKLAVKATNEIPELKDEATQATLAIAQKLGSKGEEVRELLTQAGLEKVKLEIVKAEYGSGDSLKDVTEVLQQQARDLQLLTLASANYNEAFGGDPAPNTPKQLKIQYKINGKPGEASFAENALIILPIPK
jgi:HEAT repeat protein